MPKIPTDPRSGSAVASLSLVAETNGGRCAGERQMIANWPGVIGALS